MRITPTALCRVRFRSFQLPRLALCFILAASAIAALVPIVVPGLRQAQIALSSLLASAAAIAIVSSYASWCKRGKRWLLRFLLSLAAASLYLIAWRSAAFFHDPDGISFASRELEMIVHGRGVCYYVYQHANIADGPDGVEILERRGPMLLPVWKRKSPSAVGDLFDGRQLRLGMHRLRLDGKGPTVRAWVDDKPARVSSVRRHP